MTKSIRKTRKTRNIRNITNIRNIRNIRKIKSIRKTKKIFFPKKNIMRGGNSSGVYGDSVFMPGGSGCPHRLMSKEQAQELLDGGYNGDNDC
jgi:hypothetical protein